MIGFLSSVFPVLYEFFKTQNLGRLKEHEGCQTLLLFRSAAAMVAFSRAHAAERKANAP